MLALTRGLLPGMLLTSAKGMKGKIAVSDALPSPRSRAQADEAAIATLAHQTDSNRELVRDLYDEEIAALREKATVKNFIGVIAGRRVKQRLRAMRSSHPQRVAGASTPS
jgi:hypothetical protein